VRSTVPTRSITHPATRLGFGTRSPPHEKVTARLSQERKTPRLASQTRGQTISLASTSVVKTSMAADYGC